MILDRERQARITVSQSRRDGVLHVAELNSVVSADEASATTLGIGDSSITVHCDLGLGTSDNNISLSQSGRDGILRVAELNSVVSAD